MSNLLGKKVYTTVSVGGERQRMYTGIVVEDDGSGTCKVDVMSLHDGNPWVRYEAKSNLELVGEAP